MTARSPGVMWVSLPSGMLSVSTARSSILGAYLRIRVGVSKATPLGGAEMPAWVGAAEWHMMQWVCTMLWTAAKEAAVEAAAGLGRVTSAKITTAAKIMAALASTIGLTW